MNKRLLRAGRSPRWVMCGAAMLLALLALAFLHGALPFHAAGRDCPACLALNAPAVVAADGGPVRPASSPEIVIPAPLPAPVFGAILRLKPLRAPPPGPVV